MVLFIEALGIFAGTIICLASLPRAIAISRDAWAASGESLIRNGAFVVGNVLWLAYGALLPSAAVAIVCSANALVNSYIFWKAFQIQSSGVRKIDGCKAGVQHNGGVAGCSVAEATDLGASD